MKISGYISSLRESFTKTDINQDIRLLRDSLKEVVASYKTANENLGKRQFISQTGKDYDATYKKAVKGARSNQTIIAGIYGFLQQLDEKLRVVEGHVNVEGKSDIIREAINAMDVTIVRYLELARFTVEYSNRLLLALVRCEANVANKVDELTDITRAEVEYIANNSANFWESLSKLQKSAKELDHSFKSIPDIVLNKDNADSIAAISGRDKLDPLALGFLPVAWNPFYHIGMMVAEYQAEQFEKIIEERNMIQFKLLQLKKAEQGQADPGLERRIEVSQKRLDKLNYEIQKRIEKYGLDGSQYA